MSIAILDNYRTTTSTPTASAARLQAVPAATEARGFALYVGITEEQAAGAGVSLTEVVNALRSTLASLVPQAESFAAVALAPAGAKGRNIEVVRTALRDPRAIDKLVHASDDKPAKGLTVDFARHRVYIDGRNAEFTNKEFELLKYLIDNQGETISRRELVDAIWSADDSSEVQSERTIDVHIRRLRAKINGYEDVIRTIRGGGYRFDKHPDVLIEA